MDVKSLIQKCGKYFGVLLTTWITINNPHLTPFQSQRIKLPPMSIQYIYKDLNKKQSKSIIKLVESLISQICITSEEQDNSFLILLFLGKINNLSISKIYQLYPIQIARSILKKTHPESQVRFQRWNFEDKMYVLEKLLQIVAKQQLISDEENKESLTRDEYQEENLQKAFEEYVQTNFKQQKEKMLNEQNQQKYGVLKLLIGQKIAPFGFYKNEIYMLIKDLCQDALVYNIQTQKWRLLNQQKLRQMLFSLLQSQNAQDQIQGEFAEQIDTILQSKIMQTIPEKVQRQVIININNDHLDILKELFLKIQSLLSSVLLYQMSRWGTKMQHEEYIRSVSNMSTEEDIIKIYKKTVQIMVSPTHVLVKQYKEKYKFTDIKDLPDSYFIEGSMFPTIKYKGQSLKGYYAEIDNMISEQKFCAICWIHCALQYFLLSLTSKHNNKLFYQQRKVKQYQLRSQSQIQSSKPQMLEQVSLKNRKKIINKRNGKKKMDLASQQSEQRQLSQQQQQKNKKYSKISQDEDYQPINQKHNFLDKYSYQNNT